LFRGWFAREMLYYGCCLAHRDRSGIQIQARIVQEVMTTTTASTRADNVNTQAYDKINPTITASSTHDIVTVNISPSIILTPSLSTTSQSPASVQPPDHNTLLDDYNVFAVRKFEASLATIL
jgi:hypothetical protein